MINNTQRTLLARAIHERVDDKAYRFYVDNGEYRTSKSFYPSAYEEVTKEFHEGEGIVLGTSEYEVIKNLIPFDGIDDSILNDYINDCESCEYLGARCVGTTTGECNRY